MTTPMMLAGVFSLDGPTEQRWGPAGAWRMPVGTAYALGSNGVSKPFQENRGLEFHRGRVTHQGTDLANGQAGDTVHAAASGLVVLAHDGDNGNGYGGHVVIAHRLDHDELAYTVYAHLQRGTVAVNAGDIVTAGDAIARVGATGRASTPHLHFEVREVRDPAARWETTRVMEPLPFLFAHLPGQRHDDSPERAYLEWAEFEGLIESQTASQAPLTRAHWWRMLARSIEDGPHAASAADSLRDALIEQGVLPEEEAGAPGDERLAWVECARDLKRLRTIGVRTPHGPLAEDAHVAACEQRFDTGTPASHTNALRHRSGDPTVADACVLLADVSGPRPDSDLRPASGSSHRGKAAGKSKNSRRTKGKSRASVGKAGKAHGGQAVARRSGANAKGKPAHKPRRSAKRRA